MKRIIKLLTSRLVITCLLIVIQLAALFALVINLSLMSWEVYLGLTIFSIILVVLIVSENKNPVFKVAWIIPMLMLPVLGWLLYFLFGRRKISGHNHKKYDALISPAAGILSQNEEILFEIDDQSVIRQSDYIYNTSGCPIFRNTAAEYFPAGEDFFTRYIEELNKAEKFIFIEYFIIEEGKMWNAVLEILKRKVKEGVEVRVMYDDLGCINTLPVGYEKKLREYGIKAVIFNNFRPSIDVFMNYRDHRKITVIDNRAAFTGGLNLADEYINKKVRFGYWKDCAMLMEGEAVTAMTIMFLQLWYYSSNEPVPSYNEFIPPASVKCEGYIQPFGDGPMDDHLTSELAYINIINRAKRYVYICTPYLILDNEMITALGLAATGGIDVRIITPNIPDKWYVHAVTRSNYAALIRSGVKIYEYLPGFIHEKAIICDDELCIVGTTNFDFRSFYLHFENGVFIYKAPIIKQIKEDFAEVQSQSESIPLERAVTKNIFKKFAISIMRLFAPFM